MKLEGPIRSLLGIKRLIWGPQRSLLHQIRALEAETGHSKAIGQHLGFTGGFFRSKLPNKTLNMGNLGPNKATRQLKECAWGLKEGT